MTSQTAANPVPTLLISHRLGDETRLPLQERFPRLRIVNLPEDGAVSPEDRGATVLYRAGMPHDALRKALELLPDLAWIHTASAGFNWVLIPEVVARPIRLTRTARVLDTPIAEFVIATSLALLKQLPQFLAAQQDRRWGRSLLGMRGLQGATVLVIGAGAIGRASAKRFRAFGARTVGIKRDTLPLPEFDQIVAPAALHRALAGADVIVVACPLTPETRHMLGKGEFALMKPTAVLVNIARGEVIVEDDLISALRERKISGAALDVFTVEPLPPESPLWELDNVILTPHASYYDPRNLTAAVDEFADNLERFMRGEPLQHEIKSRELGY